MSSRIRRIGINAHLLSMGNNYRAAGLSNYIENMVRGFSEVDQRNQYHIYTGPWARDPALRRNLQLERNFHLHPSRISTEKPLARILWEQLAQPFHMPTMDIAHGMAHVIPLWHFGKAKHVLTIHDLVFMVFNDKHSGGGQRRYLEQMTRLSAQRAKKIIAVSENTKNDIIRFLGVAEDKIIVVPEAAGKEYRPYPKAEIEAFREQKGLPERFFLYLGTLEPRKNVQALLHAYAALREISGDKALKLVVAGAKGWHYETIFQIVEELGIKEHVIFPGFVAREEVALWFNSALAFVYLSEYEGFGLPPLQAMACRVPVVVNNVSSLPEVVGDGGYLLDANDTKRLAQTLQILAEDKTVREEMAEKALAKSTEFSWAKAARGTLAVYEAALS